MPRILITSGPTRQYLDPVRYLTNASSGRMGQALADAASAAGYEVVIVSGPVEIEYADQHEVIPVVSTEEMLIEACRLFSSCDGAIGVAAPCDYRPVRVQEHKISKTGSPLELHLVETPDVVARLGAQKQPHQWVVGFALESEDHRFRAIRKMEQKSCDLMVINSPEAMNAMDTCVEILDSSGTVTESFSGSKSQVAVSIIRTIQRTLIDR